MAAPTLSSTINFANAQISKLHSYKTDAETLDAKYQHIIAEMIMLRLFSIFEDSVADLAFKITAGATYSNGVIPTISAKTRRTADSRGLLLSYGRARPESNLKWTNRLLKYPLRERNATLGGFDFYDFCFAF
jgi:hypothetical protein